MNAKRKSIGITINPDAKYVFKNVAVSRTLKGELIWEYLLYSRRFRHVQTITCTPAEIIPALEVAGGVESVSADFLYRNGAFAV